MVFTKCTLLLYLRCPIWTYETMSLIFQGWIQGGGGGGHKVHMHFPPPPPPPHLLSAHTCSDSELTEDSGRKYIYVTTSRYPCCTIVWNRFFVPRILAVGRTITQTTVTGSEQIAALPFSYDYRSGCLTAERTLSYPWYSLCLSAAENQPQIASFLTSCNE